MKHANRAIFNQFSKAIRAAMVLLVFALWLVQKTHATFSTNQEPNWNQSRLGHLHFPAFNKFSCFYSEFSMAPFDILYRSALRLAAVITLVLGLRHSIEYALKAQVLIILVLGEYSPSAVSFRWYCFAIQFRRRWYFCLVSHVVEHRTAVRKVESLSSRSDQHSGS